MTRGLRVAEPTCAGVTRDWHAHGPGYDGPPFAREPERRFRLRCELDAAFFHLYGVDRDDAAYILDTFPIVRRNEEARYGEYRTKRVVLELYEAYARAGVGVGVGG